MNNTFVKVCLCSLFLLIVSVSGCTDTAKDHQEMNIDEKYPDSIYQVSTIDALLEGAYDGETSFEELKEQGDFGLGTFQSLDGEMIALDGDFYQVRSDGVAYAVNDSMKTPFSAVTFFETDATIPIEEAVNFSQTKALIEGIIPSENLMYAIRIDGEFDYMKTRSVPAQTKPYPLLIDVINNEQAVFELSDVKGSIAGFWLPYYVEGMNVPGYHFHFINKQRNAGGHILDYEMTSGTIYIDYTYELELTLPETDEFANLDLQREKNDELHSVESNKK